MNEMKFPVMDVKMVSINKILANDYNPNHVSSPEMKLLENSLKEDGYTQPIVCYYDEEVDKYIIIDGFHRFKLAKEVFLLKEVPVTILVKDRAHRMASTIRHNRARGKHAVSGMVNLVEDLVLLGWSDDKICRLLGMDLEEVFRLKQSTGLKKIFSSHSFSDSWKEFENKYYKSSKL